ncbi:S-adenosyl-L-methionine-dependent methyltransferase [Lepidopterella palustris CBS 459.81]|uniref:S-adenosyl-L-methionine-dependent methyltransferase n=1 Tax=Lepidopterella palustris CBS 459.81 TaxID=1314670 RepID=A0A8E2JKN7_9PEZI|nr:S-adenosyl-L-methionine-dependent methyltransferase [Lepidopterella palustris CBS 459.81]
MSAEDIAARKILVNIHDRDFQQYSVSHRIYCVPVDYEEEERLLKQHDVIQRLFGDRLYFPPIEYPEKVLECGYGRGYWALAMAETFEDSEVTAIDIYPAEVPEAPENLECEIWDLNRALTPSFPANTYNLIHCQFVSPGIHRNRWQNFVRDLRRLSKRGGWVQMAEYYYNFQSDAGLLTQDHALRQWGDAYRSAMEIEHRDPRVGHRLGQMMADAGLVDVRSIKYDLPIGPWSSDLRLQSIGEDNLENIGEMLDSHAIWPFTQRLGWTPEQVEALTDRARTEAGDMRFKLYIPVYVAWGRKP